MFKGITSIVLIVFFCFNLMPVVHAQQPPIDETGKNEDEKQIATPDFKKKIGIMKKPKGEVYVSSRKIRGDTITLYTGDVIGNSENSEATIELTSGTEKLKLKIDPRTRVKFDEESRFVLSGEQLKVESKGKWKWFSVKQDDLVGDLNNGEMPGKLREELEQRGIRIPESVSLNGKDTEWEIECKDDNNIKQEFAVRKEEGELNIYPKSMILTANDNAPEPNCTWKEREGADEIYKMKIPKGEVYVCGRKIEKDITLYAGDRITTREESEATIELNDGTYKFTVDKKTEVQFVDWNISKLPKGCLRVESKDKWEWFSVEEDDLVGVLNNRDMPDKLRGEFEGNKIEPPSDPSDITVSVKRKDTEWRIEWSKLLFSTDLGAESDLDNGTISEYLRKAFEDKGYSLSNNATVLVDKAGAEWRIITDANRTYIVKKQKNKLNICDNIKQEFIVCREKGKLSVRPMLIVLTDRARAGALATDFLISVNGDKTTTAVAKGEVGLRPLKPGSAEEILGQKTQKTISEKYETKHLPKTSKAWKWGMLGGSAVALGGLAYVAHRLISKDDEISKSSGKIMEYTDTVGVIEKNVQDIKGNTGKIRDSLDKIVGLSTGQAKNEAATGEAPGGTAGIPCEDILAAIEEIDKAADGISKADAEIGKESGTIRDKAEDNKATFIERRNFLATAAGIGVVASIVLILLHDVYAGVDDVWVDDARGDDSDTSLLMEPELNSQHAGIKLGVKQRF